MTYGNATQDYQGRQDVGVNIGEEIFEQCNTSINTLIYPFGTFSSTSNKAALEHYTYLMRIGGAYNFSWKDPLLYRVSADNLTSPLSALKQPLKLFTKTLLKKARCH